MQRRTALDPRSRSDRVRRQEVVRTLASTAWATVRAGVDWSARRSCSRHRRAPPVRRPAAARRCGSPRSPACSIPCSSTSSSRRSREPTPAAPSPWSSSSTAPAPSSSDDRLDELRRRDRGRRRPGHGVGRARRAPQARDEAFRAGRGRRRRRPRPGAAASRRAGGRSFGSDEAVEAGLTDFGGRQAATLGDFIVSLADDGIPVEVRGHRGHRRRRAPARAGDPHPVLGAVAASTSWPTPWAARRSPTCCS